MSFSISDTLQLSFYFNGVELPLAPSNIESLLVVSNINASLPTIRIDILDDKKIFINDFTIVDGSVITIAIGDNLNTSNQETYDFMVVGMPEKIIASNNVKYTLYGVLAFPKYWKTVKPYYFQGTSYQALQNIASLTGLSFSGKITADSMNWFGNNYNYAQLVSYITDYSYVDNYSCMVSFVDVLGRLNLIDCMSLEAKYKLTNVQNAITVKDTYKYSDIYFINDNGLYNFSYGYKNSLTEYGLTNDLTKSNETVNLKKNYSEYFNVNSLLYNKAGTVKSDFTPVSLGNCHSNWSKAKYQNTRIKSLFSTKAEVYFNSKTSIQVGSMVTLDYMNSALNMIDNNLAKSWFVEAKSFGISGQRYTEKLLLSSTGFKGLDNSNLT
jgi:hypothetical protein